MKHPPSTQVTIPETDTITVVSIVTHVTEAVQYRGLDPKLWE